MEKLSVWFCGLYTTPCLTGLLYGYDTVSISGAIGFLQDKYALGPVLQGLGIAVAEPREPGPACVPCGPRCRDDA